MQGDMLLSRQMERDLIAAFVDPGVHPSPEPMPSPFGGRWFCPRDGAAMREVDGLVACTVCQRSLNRYLYSLLELHPYHRTR